MRSSPSHRIGFLQTCTARHFLARIGLGIEEYLGFITRTRGFSPDHSVTMNRLPRETLCNIFMRSAPLTQTVGKPGPVSIAYTVSRVCQRWRKVAFSMGVLWSYLDIRLDPEKWQTTLEIFRAWLQRSHNAPLNYSLEFRLEDCKHELEPNLAAEFMVRALLPQQHRWENMHLDWVILVSPDFPGIRLFRMPILKKLYLTFRIETWTKELTEADINLAKCAQLEDFRLWGSYNLNTGSMPIESLSGIADFMFCGEHAHETVANQCLDFLRRTPNLQLFRAAFKHNGANVQAEQGLCEDDGELTLPNLRFLVLNHGPPAHEIIDRLTLPSLASLFYDGYDHIGEGDILLRFIERSLPPLTCLWINTFELEEETLIALLQWLPALRELGLKYMALTRRIFRELTPDESSSGFESSPNAVTHLLCPLLRSIEFDELTLAEDSIAIMRSICEFAQARCSIMKTFSAIQFGDHDPRELPGEFTEDDYKNFARIVEQEKWLRAEGNDEGWMRTP